MDAEKATFISILQDLEVTAIWWWNEIDRRTPVLATLVYLRDRISGPERQVKLSRNTSAPDVGLTGFEHLRQRDHAKQPLACLRFCSLPVSHTLPNFWASHGDLEQTKKT